MVRGLLGWLAKVGGVVVVMCTGHCLGVVAGMFVTLASAWSGIKSGR